MTKIGSTRARHDRYSEWAVFLLFALALAAGWGVMAYAQGQRESYTDATTGLTVAYPRGWLLKGDSELAFQAWDPESSGFRTTYQVKAWPISAELPLTSTLGAILNDASLARAQDGTAYRLLSIAEATGPDDEVAMESEYVYVAEGSNLFVQQLPVVVRGLDVALPMGDRAYVFTLLASESAYDRALSGFRKFVETATFQ